MHFAPNWWHRLLSDNETRYLKIAFKVFPFLLVVSIVQPISRWNLREFPAYSQIYRQLYIQLSYDVLNPARVLF